MPTQRKRLLPAKPAVKRAVQRLEVDARRLVANSDEVDRIGKAIDVEEGAVDVNSEAAMHSLMLKKLRRDVLSRQSDDASDSISGSHKRLRSELFAAAALMEEVMKPAQALAE